MRESSSITKACYADKFKDFNSILVAVSAAGGGEDIFRKKNRESERERERDL